MAVIDGKTDAVSYVVPVAGSPAYNIQPLLTVGDEVPLLTGSGFNLTPDATQKFAFAGIPDGTGLYETADSYFVFVNHEFGRTTTSFLNTTSTEKVIGARVSLYQFDKNWNVIGGKNLIETVVDEATGVTYSLDTTTGLYTSDGGQTFAGFDRFCSAYLATFGFAGGPVFFGPEESSAPGNRAWAIFSDGTAQSIDGLGRYAKETVVAASQYRATNSDKTVLISTEDAGDGEVYMWVGNQTADDPNGFKLENGDLYVLKVDGYDWETIPEGIPTTATWVKVPKEIVTSDTTGNLLTAFVNTPGNSTNFRRPEDIHEDPNNPGTFYFVTTGRTEVPGSLTQQATDPSQADNPYGKLYRFALNPLDPTGAIKIENILEGGLGRGHSYDNIVADRFGNVVIQEDETAFGPRISQAEGRDNAYVWRYNVATDTVRPLFQADESIAPANNLSSTQWETSGIIEVPGGFSNQSAYLFDVQAGSISSSRFVTGGQLLVALPLTPTAVGTAGDNVIYGEEFFGRSVNDVIIAGAGNDEVYGYAGANYLSGGDGNDLIVGGDGNDTIDGGSGNNELHGIAGNNLIIAGDGDDIAYAEDGDDVFLLGNGNNTVFANAGNDRISTGRGNDLIYADDGNDIITAGDGNNVVFAREGNNRVLTGAGNDEIWAGSGSNTLVAGAGNDTIYVSGGGNNVINAGIGNDLITIGWVGKGVDTFVLNAGLGSTTILGFGASDRITKGAGLAASDVLTVAISGNDTLISRGDDLLATLSWYTGNVTIA
ncbi:MAG: DUF839 domain-containing protein [Leptolyngbyaceae cyanobacterium bins.349]|nr:DUF839 domain-containing protein [Leptolyngbyaceae cyanobacterium bins.349]